MTDLREEFTKTIDDHFISIHQLTDPLGPPGEFRCTCGKKFGFSSSATRHVVDELMEVGRSQVEWAVVWSSGYCFTTDSERSARELAAMTPHALPATRTRTSFPDHETFWENM